MRSGNIAIYRGKLWGSGYYGSYWYAKPEDDTEAAGLDFNNDDINIGDAYNRHGGYSLRCLSTVLD